jgi:hypothetical protein
MEKPQTYATRTTRTTINDVGNIQIVTNPVEFQEAVSFLQLPETPISPAIGDAPSVLNVTKIELRNSSPTLVTNFRNGQEGQTIFLIGDGNSTLEHGTNIFTNSSGNKLLLAGSIYIFTLVEAKWREAAGSAGAAPSTSETWQERRLISTQSMLNDTTVQDWFATAPGCPLLANSTYEFIGTIFSVNGATSHGLNLQFAAVSGASIFWTFRGAKTALNNQATAIRSGTNNTFNVNRLATTASTVTGNLVRVRGSIITTTAGTLIPKVAQSAVSGSFTLQPGTFFKVRRLGSNTLTNTGEWA